MSTQHATASIAALDGVLPRARATDPITSVDAGRRIRKHELHFRLFNEVANHGPNGVTQSEMVTRFDNVATPQRIRSSFTELEEIGLLQRTDKTRPTEYGRQAQVWCVDSYTLGSEWVSTVQALIARALKEAGRDA